MLCFERMEEPCGPAINAIQKTWLDSSVPDSPLCRERVLGRGRGWYILILRGVFGGRAELLLLGNDHLVFVLPRKGSKA